jgi:predicted nucleotidyltransferase component of viral defense system
MKFLHDMADVKELFLIIADEKKIEPYLVEKDYWIMHALWGLQQQRYIFELKGGTSLSKGFKIIDRFSEDIDIQIHPNPEIKLPTGKNHDKDAHVASRKEYFDDLAQQIHILMCP